VRKDFIDKFFMALGWDVNHDEQTNPYEQEVKVEPAVSAAGQRRADYAFRLAPSYRDVRFFVEAKKPCGELATPDNYFQTIRYAWNTETPLAVLTDFNELHILDCRYKPDIDNTLSRRVAKYHYSQYAQEDLFAEIYWLFSRQAVADGSLEKRSKELPKPKGKAVQKGLFPGGYQSIDESFLSELDGYRNSLARAFKRRNPELDSEVLTEIVQRTLDRLVFLRFLEDKGIENQHIVDKFGENGTAWGDFVSACKRLNGIYNGVVFRHHSVLDQASFDVDDKVFAEICESLAHINSPYDFDAIPIHILGSIYERFLGNVIIATAKRVKIEPKPEVRKAGGVYYTPEYVVRYLTDNSVGKIISGKTPDQIAKLRFADIACGSGSFLLGVFEILLAHHGQYYNENPKRARAGDCIKVDDKLYLSLRKKREILTNNIFGVDVDAQAVEVCQLSLYLRLLKDETPGSAHQYQLEFAHTAKLKKLLPDLSKNIVCGNSLIGRDVSDGQLFEREEHQLNPMNFRDAFPEIMAGGGFNAIVGNPPYIFARDEGFTETEQRYYEAAYVHQDYQLNTATLFTEKGYDLLSKGGSLGYIIPNNWLSISTMKVFRDFIVGSTGNLAIVNNRFKVFRGASVDTSLLLFSKIAPTTVELYESLAPGAITRLDTADPKTLLNEQIIRVRKTKSEEVKSVLAKMAAASKPLQSVALVKSGLKAYEVGKGSPAQTAAMKNARIYHSTAKDSDFHRKYLDGRDVGRYEIDWSGAYLKYGSNLAAPRDKSLFEGERILIRQIPSRMPYAINGAILSGNEVNDLNSMIVRSHGIYSNHYLLGILNSRLMSFWFDVTYDKFQRGIFPQFKINELSEFPVCTLDLSRTTERKKHDDVAAKVASLLAAKTDFARATTDKNRNFYGNKVDSLDKQIDTLVYSLYSISETEIEALERASESNDLPLPAVEE
jgi:adenine-specific DNA-methyltransferase